MFRLLYIKPSKLYFRLLILRLYIRHLTFYISDWFHGFNQYNKQPSDDGFSNEDCVELRRSFKVTAKDEQLIDSYQWNDRNCVAKNAFICQMSLYQGEAIVITSTVNIFLRKRKVFFFLVKILNTNIFVFKTEIFTL